MEFRGPKALLNLHGCPSPGTRKLRLFAAVKERIGDSSLFLLERMGTVRPRKTGKLVLRFVEVSRQSAEKSLSGQMELFS
jgi:hypothetical protein